jgi:hypothetical protein
VLAANANSVAAAEAGVKQQIIGEALTRADRPARLIIPTFVGIDSSDIVAWRPRWQAKPLSLKMFSLSVRGPSARTKSHRLRRLV